LSAAGLEDGFFFVYKHYGPFSEDLADAARDAGLLGLLRESEERAAWGGRYSVFSVDGATGADGPPARRELAREAAASDAIELELAATAVYLAEDRHPDPWAETERRKPQKAEDGRIDRARPPPPRPRPWPPPCRRRDLGERGGKVHRP